MQYREARQVAVPIYRALLAVADTERGGVMPCGALRRHEAEVPELVFVVLPRMVPAAEARQEGEPEPLTELPAMLPDLAAVREVARGIGEMACDATAAMLVRRPDGMLVTLRLVLGDAQMGVLTLLETGPAEYWGLVLSRLASRGYDVTRAASGIILFAGAVVAMPTEIDALMHAGLPAIAPEMRGDPTAVAAVSALDLAPAAALTGHHVRPAVPPVATPTAHHTPGMAYRNGAQAANAARHAAGRPSRPHIGPRVGA
jgi:hypothetical protein